MSQRVDEIRVLNENGGSIFAEPGVTYEIPIYQRAFAWGTELAKDINRVDEVCQLMDDVWSAETGNYYIGSMVVHRPESGCPYEVIDGQQRLTALYVILKCLNWQLQERTISFCNGILKYANREYSQNAIDNLDAVISTLRTQTCKEVTIEKTEEGGEKWTLTSDGRLLEANICDAVRRVFVHFDEKGKEYQERLFESLKKVKLYRVEVPEDTDLNRYFEIMNVRGKQLEPSDVVKARLMGVLENDKKREIFARIWNACRDMSGYVQMHFSVGDRKVLFGDLWDLLPDSGTAEKLLVSDAGMGGDGISEVDNEAETMLSAILEDKVTGSGVGKCDNGEVSDEDDGDYRFRSVTDFHHFLLHVLRVFKNWQRESGGVLQGGPLNEKDIAGEFERSLPEEKAKSAAWAWDYVICLLKCRFLFDTYIIKRDYHNDPKNGEWSLAAPKKNGKSWRYEERAGDDAKRCLMIESCLRVTYTEHKSMHWITKMLDWLLNRPSEEELPKMVDVSNFCDNEIAKPAVGKNLADLKGCHYRMGTRTPHLLFNYLDYLRWSKNNNHPEFNFEFRNSVEHWYPQHPTTIVEWESGIKGDETDDVKWLDRDGFGNLCLIHASENSRFSNLPPIAKANYSPDMNARGSLKYRAMVEKIKELVAQSATTANQDWQTKSFEHGKEMLELLAGAVGFNLELDQHKWNG